MPFAVTWMDLEIVLLSEVSQTEYDITYMWNLKIWLQINFIHNINRYRKYDYGYRKYNYRCSKLITKGKGGEENYEFGVNIYIQLYVK